MPEPSGAHPEEGRKRAAVYTLGCRLNQAETRLLKDSLRDAGYAIVPFGEPADLGVIHTCVVTREAEAKSRKYIRRFLHDNPGAVTAVIGCYAQTAAEAIAAMGGVDLVLGNDAKMRLPEHLAVLTGEAPVVLCGRAAKEPFSIPFLPAGPPITRRVNLKIQDGCDLMCSYCYIPFARGRSRSRRLEDALAEAQALVGRGARELVIAGVNIGDYEDSGRNLVHLVDGISALEPQPRIRISSIELTNLPEALFERMADPAHGLVAHLHIPLQSGSDAILEAMRRPYTARRYLDLLQRAAQAVPGIGLGADVLVGFPGEQEADFEATFTLVRESPLFYLHVFQYSERSQVASSRLPDKVPDATAKARAGRLHLLGEEKKRQFLHACIGKTLDVLFESQRGGSWVGHADTYVEVVVTSDENLENRVKQVRITRACDTHVEGVIR